MDAKQRGVGVLDKAGGIGQQSAGLHSNVHRTGLEA